MNRYERMWATWAQSRSHQTPKSFRFVTTALTMLLFWPIHLFLYIMNRVSNATQDTA